MDFHLDGMIRLFLIVTFLVVYLVLSLPFLGVERLIARRNRYAADIARLHVVQWAFKVVLWLSGTHLTVIGEEHVPKDQAVLYIGNHRSFFDIVITYARCPRLTGYIAKDSMKHVPLLSLWMKRLYCLFLNRDDVKEGLKTILTGIEQIKNGISMCIFPEGTRGTGIDEADMLPFKEGSLKMAEKTGCPIIPMELPIFLKTICRGFIRRALPCSMANRFTPKNCPRKNRSVWGIIRRGSFSI